MKLKHILLICACITVVFLLASFSQAQSKTMVQGLFYKANELFKESEYEKAKHEYLNILDAGVESGSIYYNLGNTFFKLGQIGKAIVNYERAKLFLPQDSDVLANLSFSLSLCKNPVVPEKQIWVISAGSNLAEFFTLDGLTKLLSGIFLFVLITAAVFNYLKNREFKKVAVWATVVLCFTAYIWTIKLYETRFAQNAIVIASEIDAKFAPSDDAVVHFEMYEGAKIRVIDENGSWLRIKTPDGNIGWVIAAAVEKI